MNGSDPHIHVGVGMGGDAATRDMLASTFGLVGDLPSQVTTGCNQDVPRAMTSSRPESVTCLACREYARGEHLRRAGEVENLARMPGSPVSIDQAKPAADRHRELAERYSGGKA